MLYLIKAQTARYQGGQYDWLCTFRSLQRALCSAVSISECVAVFFCSLVNCYSKRVWIIIPSGQTSSSKNEFLASGTLNQLEVQLLLNYNRHTSGGGGGCRGRHYAPCIYLYFTKQEGCQKQHDYKHLCTTYKINKIKWKIGSTSKERHIVFCSFVKWLISSCNQRNNFRCL